MDKKTDEQPLWSKHIVIQGAEQSNCDERKVSRNHKNHWFSMTCQ